MSLCYPFFGFVQGATDQNKIQEIDAINSADQELISQIEQAILTQAFRGEL
jgi:hypothetical protein